jgi:hypothetical protein
MGLVVAAVLALASTPSWAQGKSKDRKTSPKVTMEAAISVTKDVLVKSGFEIVRVEVEQDRRIVYYRAGNQGRGKGQGPPVRMVLRQTEERLVVEEAPEALKIEIGVRLGIKL